MFEDLRVSLDANVLVTGASGFIGARVVHSLLEIGFRRIRCFIRQSSDLSMINAVMDENLEWKSRIEFVQGDLLVRDDCIKAVDGISIIYHLAAGFDKAFAAAFMNSVLATRNLIESFLCNNVKDRGVFVNVSSFSVYSNLNMKRGELMVESSPLEENFQSRHDAYGFGKIKQELLVKNYGSMRDLRYVIVRPGLVYGPGKKELSGRIGFNTFGIFVHVGGSNYLPMTYVDNCADAIVLAGAKSDTSGEIFNIVDDELMTSGQFLKACKIYGVPRVYLRIPYIVAYMLCLLWEAYSRWSRGQVPPAFNRRRCAADWKGNRFSNQKIKNVLGWRPRIRLAEGMNAYLSQLER